ncbi:hypothetical protein ASD00_33435 [Ensifer sp. Root31]|uniref:hypothetical protein n=1 Tax=Ensifer sp. Root31 TaxID=1736512 RepID=UPI00070C2134|nr:hypothetical protein [Ensifer sp. Root31]KQU84526.1 hypothetical protein ASD00_33435 [Ensifer sp. Root31]
MFFDWADEAEIDLVILQPLHDVVGRADHDMQLDIGVFAADARQERRRHVNGCGIDNSDPDLAHRIAGNRTQHLGRQIDIAQDPHKLTIVDLPVLVSSAFASIAPTGAQFLFRRLNLTAQARPGDMHPGCRATKIKLLGNRHEIAQLAKSHSVLCMGQPRSSLPPTSGTFRSVASSPSHQERKKDVATDDLTAGFTGTPRCT